MKRVRQMTGEDGKEMDIEPKVSEGEGSAQGQSLILYVPALPTTASVGQTEPALAKLVDTGRSVDSHDLSVCSGNLPWTHCSLSAGEVENGVPRDTVLCFVCTCCRWLPCCSSVSRRSLLLVTPSTGSTICLFIECSTGECECSETVTHCFFYDAQVLCHCRQSLHLLRQLFLLLS